MSQSRAVLSLGYWFSAYTLGLLLHPYKTLRELMRERRFRVLLVAPVVFWVMAWVSGLVLFRVGGGLLDMVGLERFGDGLLRGLAFVWWWLTVFLVMWQVLLGYLGVRFWGVARVNSKVKTQSSKPQIKS